ncbi:MAG: IS630 family transposase [Prochloraceae cyanobacterium]|nr:IS630 family transposase [Prochloraceae cyanobacterium]
MNDYRKIRYWCQDETRFGLQTISRRKITACGIKTIGIEQWKFLYRWLYGLVEPLTGESFFWEFTHLNSVCFEIFLELFSKKYPKDLHIIQLDNGGLHKALSLNIPDNIILLFQPPYCPQVNPIERLWAALKENFKWINFQTIEELQTAITKNLNKLSKRSISRLTGWKFIIDALCVANI